MWILNDVEPLTWRDWVNEPTRVAIVNLLVYNRSHVNSKLIIALAEKNREALPIPTGLTATKVGKHEGGTFEYSYRLTAFDHSGETLASESVTVTDCLETFDEENYVRLTWDAVPGAVGYRVYGRQAGAEVLLTEVETTEYDDKMIHYLGSALPVFNTTRLKTRIFDGVLDAKHMLKSQEKIILDAGTKLIVITDGRNFEFTAMGVEV